MHEHLAGITVGGMRHMSFAVMGQLPHGKVP
jgi:hypothetical protein